MIDTFLQGFPFFSKTDIENLKELLVPKTISKGDFFIREGKPCKEVAFIKTGILRSFYTTPSGEEITYCITFPNTFMTAYSSFITGQPTLENIQALSDTELLVISKPLLDKLTGNNSSWLRFQKIMAEQQYIELEKRLFLFQKDKAKQRYLDLLEHHPDYLQQIPLQYLASYLGITPRHLSRLRSAIFF